MLSATMNALTALCWDRRLDPDVEMEIGVDAFDAAGIRPGQTVVCRGRLVSFLRELKRRRQPYLVLETDPKRLRGRDAVLPPGGASAAGRAVG